MKILISLVCVCAVMTITGCASFGIDGWMQNSRTIKAEERMLLVTDKAAGVDKNGIPYSHNKRVVCAEPSPDAMTALALTGSLKGSYMNQAEGGLTFAASQAIGELGERTPVIQMLRDSLYRACEAHMNGLLADGDYHDILQYFDIYSMTVMAIEDLTKSSTLKSPTIISTGADAKINADKSLEAQVTPGQEPSVVQNASDKSTDNSNKSQVGDTVKSILCNYYKLKEKLIIMKTFKEGNELYKNNNTQDKYCN